MSDALARIWLFFDELHSHDAVLSEDLISIVKGSLKYEVDIAEELALLLKQGVNRLVLKGIYIALGDYPVDLTSL